MSHHDEHYDREVIKHDPKEGFDPTEPASQQIMTFVIGSVAYATAVYSTRYSGLISGIGAGSWSAWVALVMPVLTRS